MNNNKTNMKTIQEKMNEIKNKYDYIERMQKGMGQNSWTYSNRKSGDCIDVKVYAYVKSDHVKELLTADERKNIDILKIDIFKVIEENIWGSDFCMGGIVTYARESLLENVKDNFRRMPSNSGKYVENIEYGGRSGGWMCVVYDFDDLLSNMYDVTNNEDASTGDINSVYEKLENALSVIDEVTYFIKEKHKELCNLIREPHTHVEAIQEAISSRIEDMKAKAISIKETLQKINNL